MKKVALIFGTRPEAIKLAPVIHALKARNDIVTEVCVTGQHKEMLDQVLTVFSITPDQNLAVMTHDQTLTSLTARLLEGIDGYLTESKPDLVLVQGDTTSVFAAALAAFNHRIPLGHVEAGLRTGSLAAPWPEEANRVLTTRLTTLHFAPTERALKALLDEGVSQERIFRTGNTVIDALQYVRDRLSNHDQEVRAAIPGDIVDSDNRLVLITGHRRENFEGGLLRMCRAVARLAEKHPAVSFVYPAHLNPRVQEAVRATFGTGGGAVRILPPLSYIPFVWLMRRSHFIITDSGGVQEEAPALGKPVLVTREVTERPEGIESGNALLVGTDEGVIESAAEKLLTDQSFYDSMAHATNPYGDGTAADQITRLTADFLISPKFA